MRKIKEQNSFLKISFQKMNKKKKIVLGLLTVFSTIFLISGTYAWSAYTDWVRNHVQSLGFDSGQVVITEEFEGDEKPIVPGDTIKKEVNVINTSPVDSYVRVSFEESLQKLNNFIDIPNGPSRMVPSFMNEFQSGVFEHDLEDVLSWNWPFGLDAMNDKRDDEGRRAAFPVIFDPQQIYREDSLWVDQTNNYVIDKEMGTGGFQHERVKASDFDPHLRLFVKGNEKLILRETGLKKTDFPKDYLFSAKKAQFPMIVTPVAGKTYEELQVEEYEKFLTGEEVLVAQKVGGIIRVDEKTQKFVSNTGYLNALAKPYLKYYTLGAKIDKQIQVNWAGKSQWVTDVGGSPGEYYNFAGGRSERVFDSLMQPTMAKSLISYFNKPQDLVGDEIDRIEINLQKGAVIVGDSQTFDFSKIKDKEMWFFNVNDGYFYYTVPLKAGQITAVPVIKKVTFPLLPSYSISAYTLHAGSEAVPAQKTMLTAETKEGHKKFGSGGSVESPADVQEYQNNGRVVVSNGVGFDLNKEDDKALVEYLANQATIKED